MIVEVNDKGDVLVPAEVVRAAPHTRLRADRDGDTVVLKPLGGGSEPKVHSVLESLLVIEGRLVDPGMTFRREDIYGDDAR